MGDIDIGSKTDNVKRMWPEKKLCLWGLGYNEEYIEGFAATG